MKKKLVVKLELPEDILRSLNKTPEELTEEIKLMVAMRFFEVGKLSIGEAAKLAGMDKWTFIEELDKHKISIFNYPPKELERDLEDIGKEIENGGIRLE